MRTFRICLVILLALLLSVRGAAAAAMPCGGAGAPGGGVQSHATVHGHGDHRHDAGVAAAAADAFADPGLAAGAQTCGICASCCSGSALLGSLAAVASPHAFGLLRFPSTATADASFITGGLERPPRSI